jgi:hypothetical protein
MVEEETKQETSMKQAALLIEAEGGDMFLPKRQWTFTELRGFIS